MIFTSCKKENMCDCIKRTGKIETSVRSTSSFDKLVVFDNVNVFITQGAIEEVKIEAGKNIIDLITTEVNNGKLIIKNKNKCNWVRSYKKAINVYITMPSVSFITSEGTGTIKSTNTLTSNEIELRTKNAGNIELTVNNTQIVTIMNSTGDISLTGSTNTHSCDIGGTAFLNCKNLVTNFTWVHSYTTGLCYVNSSNTIECKLDNIGDIHCYGNPTSISKEENAEGKLYIK